MPSGEPILVCDHLTYSYLGRYPALADVSAYAKVMGTRVDLVSFPTNPKPNTKVVTGLGKVVDLIEAGLKKQLSTGLNGALGPLAGVIDQTTVLNNLIDNLSTQLAPLEQNVIDGTLNLQPKHARNQISATALDLDVLPVAKSFGVTALHVEIGKSTCGPDDRVALPTKTPSPHPTSTPHPHHHPGGMPTAVDAGLASAGPIDHGQGGVSPLGAAALAGILVLATGAGTAAYRRSMRS